MSRPPGGCACGVGALSRAVVKKSQSGKDIFWTRLLLIIVLTKENAGSSRRSHSRRPRDHLINDRAVNNLAIPVSVFRMVGTSISCVRFATCTWQM